MSEQNIPKKRARRVGGSRVVFSLVVTLLFACVYFYIALPAINLHDPGFYFFFLLCSVIFCQATCDFFLAQSLIPVIVFFSCKRILDRIVPAGSQFLFIQRFRFRFIMNVHRVFRNFWMIAIVLTIPIFDFKTGTRKI